ncbi:MAG: flagellar hook protein FlgE [Phycisphaerales bacterium]
MPSTTALYTALSGLNANARNIDVVGNNIANINTTAFKSSRLMFSSMFSKTISGGTPPGDTSGGTNPHQIGFGVNVAGTQRNFASGGLTTTGDSRDLAIEGDGFFMVQNGSDTRYTRAGAFRQNANQDLTTIGGQKLLGYGVDADFNITPGALVDLNIPLGGLPIANATENVTLRGNLKSDGELPSQGSLTTLGASTTTGFRAISTAVPAPGAGNQLELTTLLTQIEDPDLPGTDTPLFFAGQSIELRDAEKGAKNVPTATLAVAATTTVQDFVNFMNQALGIVSTVGANPDGRTPGATLDPTTGVLSLTGNTGTLNDIALDTTDLRLLDASGVSIGSPFVSSKLADADGESVRTTFVAYDSLGSTVSLDATFVLDSRTSSTTTWRYYLESADDSDLSTNVGTGTLSFDTDGQLIDTAPVTVSLDRINAGVNTPMTFTLRFQDQQSVTTSLAANQSKILASFRDGAPLGTLSAFTVGGDGVIIGSFTNGLSRPIGQVALATFANNEGLVDEGDGLFRPGANSGTPMVTTPGTLGAGTIVAESLEISNVELGDEFIKLIQASTGYSANSRVIRTTDELMQQLLVLGR